MDSGIGGLSVANIFLGHRPGVKLTYLGDNAYFPYGELDRKTILERSIKAIHFLKSRGCEKIIIACNTASIIAEQENLTADRDLWLITPPIIKYIRTIDPESISIYATSYTAKSNYYTSAFTEMIPFTSIQTFARPDLVDAVEHSGVYPQSHEIERKIGESEGKVVLLACTHFHYLKPVFHRHFAGRAEVVDSAEVAAFAFLQAIPQRSGESVRDIAPDFFFTASEQLPHIAINTIRKWDARPLVITIDNFAEI